MQALRTQGIPLPLLGLGTFRMQGDACRAAVESALELGCRHIDTAQMYANEDAIGAGRAAAGVKRADLHVTTKVWHENLTPDGVRRSFDESLDKLKLDYVDLYLIHGPSRTMDLPALFEVLIALQAEGHTRAIGVANFTLSLLRTVVQEIKVPIACNQIEYHVLLDQARVHNYLKAHSIPLVAYCPLAQGHLAEQPELLDIARKHGATPAQVALKWLLDQGGVAAIPKAQHAERQKENLGALSLTLDDEDRAAIARLPKTQRLVNPPFAPDRD
jgi:2,5-diketo-D-gluconate reductase B